MARVCCGRLSGKWQEEAWTTALSVQETWMFYVRLSCLLTRFVILLNCFIIIYFKKMISMQTKIQSFFNLSYAVGLYC